MIYYYATLVVLLVWWARVKWCHRADRMALLRDRPVCKHNAVNRKTCATCRQELEEFFAKPERGLLEIPAKWSLATDVTVWTTRDRRQIPIVEMETDHLINAIRLIERRYAANPRYDSIVAFVPQYSSLYAEAQRRGVEHRIANP